MIVVVNNGVFAWNIAKYVSFFDKVQVVDSVKDSKKYDPDGIILSSGTGDPAKYKLEFDLEIPILGIGLGCQMIALYFRGKVVKNKPVHAKVSKVFHDNKGIYEGVENPLKAARYDNFLIKTVPEELIVTALSSNGEIMGIRHKKLLIEGIQFHPESVLTPKSEGLKIFSNFVKICNVR